MLLVLHCNVVCLCVCPTGPRQDPPMYHINMDHVGEFFCETTGQLYLNPWDQPVCMRITDQSIWFYVLKQCTTLKAFITIIEKYVSLKSSTIVTFILCIKLFSYIILKH